MEHKLITGGEQYLPFARSRIKALRATGLKYASQQFEIDGCSVKVRIEPGHEYVSLSGGFVSFSGVTKSAVVAFSDGKKLLRSYKPTAQALKRLYKAATRPEPGKFFDEEKLVTYTHPSIIDEDRPGEMLQAKNLAGSMYSGKMAKLVQILMGYGAPFKPSRKDGKKEDGLRILYDYHWKRCHGVVTDGDTRPWLVEISKENGVLAMRLPMLGSSLSTSSHVGQEVLRLFGGTPSGASFPADTEGSGLQPGAALASAIESGQVRVLITPDDMHVFFDKITHSTLLGWSFNETGSEAHNTCVDVRPGSPDATAFGQHYKISFTFGKLDDKGEISTRAVISLVSEGVLRKGPVTQQGAFYFSEEHYDTWANEFSYHQVEAICGTSYDSEATFPATSGPILACHVEGALEVVYLNRSAGAETVSNYIGEDMGVSRRLLTYQLRTHPHSYITSTRYPEKQRSGSTTTNSSHAIVFQFTSESYLGAGPLDYYTVYLNSYRGYMGTGSSVTVYTPRGRTGAAPAGARDCYSYLLGQESTRVNGHPGQVITSVHDYGVPWISYPSYGWYSSVASRDRSSGEPVIPNRIEYTIESAGPSYETFTYGDAVEVAIVTPTGEVEPKGFPDFRGATYIGGVGGGSRFGGFVVRYSVLGEDLQMIYTDRPQELGLRHIGSLLDAEPTVIPPSGYTQEGAQGITFIGYASDVAPKNNKQGNP